jgi:hypothetical protein
VAFLQHLVSNDKYRMQENKKHPTEVVEQWVTKISTKNEDLGGHKICPFARRPRVIAVEKLCLENFLNLNDQITVYMETDLHSSYEELEEFCKILKEQNPNFIFLPDHPSKKNYIKSHETGNGSYPCIIVQTRQELDTARAALDKTDYYTYWDQTYLAEIRSFD